MRGPFPAGDVCTGDGGLPAAQVCGTLCAAGTVYRAKSFSITHSDKLTDALFSREIVDWLKEQLPFLLLGTTTS